MINLILQEVYMVEMKCIHHDGRREFTRFCIAVDDDPELAKEFAKVYFDNLKVLNNWATFEIEYTKFIYDSIWMEDDKSDETPLATLNWIEHNARHPE